jgi:hypothetical protein
MFDYIPYLLAFIAGILVKWVDWIDDDEKGRSKLKYPLAIAYGLIIGYLISSAPFAEIFLAAVVAQIFARKIDTQAHLIGFAVIALSLLFFGFPQISLAFFVYFLALAFLDEQEYAGKLKQLSDYRPFLKVGSLVMLFFGRWEYPAGILIFDAGYLLFQELKKKKAI